jgi:hypothetical protein
VRAAARLFNLLLLRDYSAAQVLAGLIVARQIAST